MAKPATKQKATKAKKSKARRKVKAGVVHIKATFNNTLITITDQQGNVIASSSSGRVGFSGTRKSTPYAATQAVTSLMEQVKQFGLEEASIIVKGVGSARDAAVRGVSAAGVNITAIRDMTPIPHNGVRPPRRRRI
ncbi:MAG: 30S ribosomal protein S11 [Candidatus Andersenbacteria bacterium RIFCSPHIGHO2_12_FULL_45_11b]|uniref:Small ribosomal subunit protein uS11 n=1 Tax=Candidatus Andersenbacteria bacterium RIFCSPHIGHO2_12_FULL_45_11b TaxID=1797282 RepID=A0A1G1X9A4_9BACT|nr:MAG: 30S ribosomal protein S11 [Candidatus Andersenbacteria bacterium RIFCSPHIGHO2_12_FULL_45_11b]